VKHGRNTSSTRDSVTGRVTSRSIGGTLFRRVVTGPPMLHPSPLQDQRDTPTPAHTAPPATAVPARVADPPDSHGKMRKSRAKSVTDLRNRSPIFSRIAGDGNREPQVPGQETDHLTRHLQVGHPPVEIDPVEALQIQTDVPVQDVVHSRHSAPPQPASAQPASLASPSRDVTCQPSHHLGGPRRSLTGCGSNNEHSSILCQYLRRHSRTLPQVLAGPG